MRFRHFLGLTAALVAANWPARLSAAGQTNTPNLPPVIAYLSPEDEQKTFFCQDDYSLQLVLADPIIKEPVLTVFDGNGRMFVAEMRSYMQDIDGTDQRRKNSRVSVHWSSKHDGVYDKHAIFADNLVLPRMILPLDDGVIINETDSDDFYLYKDTKHDGVADQKTLFFGGGGRGGNLEHQAGGIIWDLDNWIYIAVDAYRLRVRNGKVTPESIAPNGGQWGLCQDDYGKPWGMNAGYEAGPINFQVSFQYLTCDCREQKDEEYYTVYPLIGLADVQGGPMRFRPEEKSLNHFTATCGDEIYRGDRLPSDLRGDLLFCEPVGRLIRRSKVDVKEGFTYLHNTYPKSEFIRSTDPCFRPVNLINAPDGSIYVTDMYRGVIQEKDWVNQGSYLRGVVQQYNLDKNVGRGRIWRLVHKNFQPGQEPQMLDEPTSKLVTYLEHPNGWWRDTAEKLIVLRDDKSVVPALEQITVSSTNALARLTALWTLNGLNSLQPSLVLEKLKDSDPHVRAGAIHASEDLYKSGDHSLVPAIKDLAKDSDPTVVEQTMMTAYYLRWPEWQAFVSSTVASSSAFGIKRLGLEMGAALSPPATPPPNIPGRLAQPPPPRFTASEKQELDHGEIIYKQLCFACHGIDGKGTPFGGKPGVTMAPPLSHSRTATGFRDGVIDVVLKGLSGPVDGKTYDAQMVPMESNDDAWIAAILSYIRNNFDNHATFITSNDVARVRAAIADHTNAWTIAELHEILPQPIPYRRQWKLSASNNGSTLRYAIDGNPLTRYDSHAAQTPGMWVEVELPKPTELSGVELDSGNNVEDYARSYRVDLSLDGVHWVPVATGHANAIKNQIIFSAMDARYVRITLTGSDPVRYWSIAELQLLKVLTPEDLLEPPDTEITSANPLPPGTPSQPIERTPFTVE